MNRRPAGNRVYVCHFCASVAGPAAALLGCLSMGGWVFGIDRLRRGIMGSAAMAPNVAIGVALAGFALWLLHRESSGTALRKLALVCAGIVVLIGALTSAEYLFAIDLAVDHWLSATSGRPPFLAALSFVGLG